MGLIATNNIPLPLLKNPFENAFKSRPYVIKVTPTDFLRFINHN